MKNNSPKIITRFPPSPTGFLHVGSVRTALFNYLFAKKNNGSFVLRIEDTDRERSKLEFEEDIKKGLAWLGLNYDNKDVWRQSERGAVYQKYLQKLVDEDKAYVSKEEAKEEGQRTEVIRFRNPNKKVSWNDLIRGEVTFDTTELKDFVIAKSLTEPLYHLAVVIDDHESGVTHVIRGEDGISNTPRQILIGEAIGATQPTYAHLPLILDNDRAKLSKRKHGEKVSLDYYVKAGYLKEAIINYLALLGWNPGTEQEIFSLDELITTFDLSRVQKAGAIFNVEKLNSINKEYLRKADPKLISDEIARVLPGYPYPKKLVPVVLDRIEKISDIEAMQQAGELDYFSKKPTYGISKLVWKTDTLETSKSHLASIIKILTKIPEADFKVETIKKALWDYATEKGRGNVLWPMRYALSGRDKSPDPFTLAEILGKQETIDRLTLK